jgi:TolB protein
MSPSVITRKRATPILAALLLIASMILAACGEPDPSLDAAQQAQQPGTPQGEILFIADGNVMRWDGRVEQVTRGIHAASPSWAPAGDRFAYVAVNDAFSDIIVARRDGSPLVAVTEGHRPDFPEFSEEFVVAASWAWDVDWSPVGEQLVYVSDKGGQDRFSRPLLLWYSETFAVGPYLLNASAEIGVTQESPTISPDGNVVAFVARNEYEGGRRVSEIWTLDLNAATYEQLITSDDGAYAPEWSPDGENLAYVQRTGQTNDVWIAPIDGSSPYQLTNIGTVNSPVWSPDGRFIAFFRESRGEFEAWYVEVTVGANGRYTASEPRQLFNADDIDTVSGMSWIQN